MRLGRYRILPPRPRRIRITHRAMFQKIIILFLAGLLLYLTVLFFVTVRPLIMSLAENKAKNIAIKVVNKSVSDAVSENSVNYESLITIMKNELGEITALQAKTLEINEFRSCIQDNVQGALWELDTANVGFPLGNVFGNEFLSGIGPIIHVKILPVGMATVDFGSSFVASGINQTKHEIFLEVDAVISVIMPGIICDSGIKTKVPVAETIIVGNVPTTYFSLN